MRKWKPELLQGWLAEVQRAGRLDLALCSPEEAYKARQAVHNHVRRRLKGEFPLWTSQVRGNRLKLWLVEEGFELC